MRNVYPSGFVLPADFTSGSSSFTDAAPKCYDMDFGIGFSCSLCRFSGKVKVKYFDLIVWSSTPSDNSSTSYLSLRI